MVSSSIRGLIDFWNELKNKAEIKFKDIEELEKMLGNVFERMNELEKSRDKWKIRALSKYRKV